MKHNLEECTILRRYFSRQGPPKGDTEKKEEGGVKTTTGKRTATSLIFIIAS
jgi:hypothetical protein